MTVTDYHSEIMAITECNAEDAKIIHLMLLNRYVNLGGMKFSQFVARTKVAYLLVRLKYSKN